MWTTNSKEGNKFNSIFLFLFFKDVGRSCFLNLEIRLRSNALCFSNYQFIIDGSQDTIIDQYTAIEEYKAETLESNQ